MGGFRSKGPEACQGEGAKMISGGENRMVNLDIKEEADAVVEALEELGLGLTKTQKKDAADNFRYYNEVELDETSVGPDTANPVDESDAFPFLDEIKRNK